MAAEGQISLFIHFREYLLEVWRPRPCELQAGTTVEEGRVPKRGERQGGPPEVLVEPGKIRGARDRRKCIDHVAFADGRKSDIDWLSLLLVHPVNLVE
jgi:hypothetical protein